MPSTRKQIREAITTRLAAVAGIRSCTAWRKVPFAPHDLPAIVIADTTGSIDSETMDGHTHTLTVEAVVFVAQSAPVPVAGELAALILAAAGSDDKWGGLAVSTEPTEVTLDSEIIGDAIAVARITLTITYNTDRWAM